MIFFLKNKAFKNIYRKQNTFISKHLNDIMHTPYSGESISFVRCKLSTSDSFASCTEMDIIGNSILRFLMLGSKMVKTVKTGLPK